MIHATQSEAEPTTMPIIEVTKHHDSSRSVPLQILNKGPEYFRQQALRNQRRQGKSAAEQLAESRSQYLKRDLSPPAQMLNDNSNNHVMDNRLIHSRQYAIERNLAVVTDNAFKHERLETSEFEKQESKRGRDRHRDSKRGRRRAKGQANDLNGNNDALDVCEKASLDSPEYDGKVKEPKSLVGIGHRQTSGPTDNTDSPTQGQGYRSPRPSVKEIVFKLGGHATLENQDQAGCDMKAMPSGRQRSKKTVHLASSESSETSPILPRKTSYATRSSRPAVRSRERSKPSLPAKPSSKIFEKKSPRGSRVQNILNVLHQQTSTSSSSHDDTPRRSSRSSGARIRGKSCPPTSRTKPSLADLLAKDAEGGRPRSKDLNDLENFVSTDSEESNFVAVKARIRTLQSPSGTSAQLSLPKPISKTLSNVMKALGEQASSSMDTQGEANVEDELTQRQSTPSTPTTHFSKTDSNNSKLNDGRTEHFAAKQTNIMLDSSNMYALPFKDPVKSRGLVQEYALSENSQSSGSSVKQKVNLIAKGEFGSMKNVSSDSSVAVAKKPVLQTRSADAAVEEKQEVSKTAVRPLHLNKPVLPRKPDISVFAKASRLSYHIYEVVPEDINGARQGEALIAAGDNVFENPAHFSDPEESFEVVNSNTLPEAPTAGSTGPAAGSSGPDNVAVISEEQHVGKEGPKQGSMLSSFSSHMKRLKGILLRDKDQHNMTKDQGKAGDDVQTSGTGKSENKKLKYDSPTQRKLAAQLGIESDEEREGSRQNKYSVEEGVKDEHIYTINPTSVEQHAGNLNDRDENRRVGDMTSSQNLKLMLPIHAKSLSLDDISKKAVKPPLSESASFLSTKDDQDKKGSSTDQDPPSGERFTMPHDKQKRELSKKLEMFLKQSKAYESGGESPSKESCDSGKLKKKVSFDDTSISADTADKQSDKNTRKVSITPVCLNYDVVEYNTDWHKDQVEETIVIDRNNTIRLATPRTQAVPQAGDSATTEKKIPKVREDTVVPKENEQKEEILKDEEELSDIEHSEGVYDDVEMSNVYVTESSGQPKHTSGPKREQAFEDIQGASSGDALKSSRLLDFRKASVSTDLDTSPTHDYRTATREGLSDVKQRCGTSSSGNAMAKGEYDTSSRSDDCGLGASRGKVKHLKPYNARPFRNKNFSSDEDIIPEEHTRKSFWQTKAQLDLPSSQQKTVSSDKDSTNDGDSGAADKQSAMRRSKSEPSSATLASELNSFFDRMGLEDAILELVDKPHIYDEEEVFHDMHVWRTRALQSSESDDSNTSYAMSETSNVSEDGVMNLRKFTKQLPDQSMSIVTKNARVIKWLCQCTKARKQSVS